jgi:ankyrin repeat protein
MKWVTALLGLYLVFAPTAALLALTPEEELFASVVSGVVSSVQKRLAEGTNINARDRNGRTPLHIAVRLEEKDVADLLISKGADINARDALGKTPLHLAVFDQNQEMIALLLGKCANMNVRDNDGLTPLEAVQRQSYRGPHYNVTIALFESAEDRTWCAKDR